MCMRVCARVCVSVKVGGRFRFFLALLNTPSNIHGHIEIVVSVVMKTMRSE